MDPVGGRPAGGGGDGPQGEAGRRDSGRGRGGHATARFLDCPTFATQVQGNTQVREIMDELVRYYNVCRAVVTWRSHGELHFSVGDSVASSGIPRRWGHQEYQLFNHSIPRELPIIIYDVKNHDVYKKHVLPSLVTPVRFYAAAPLICGQGTYVGTLCIVDSLHPRPGFHLDESAYLVQKAAELVAVVGESVCLSEADGSPEPKAGPRGVAKSTGPDDPTAQP